MLRRKTFFATILLCLVCVASTGGAQTQAVAPRGAADTGASTRPVSTLPVIDKIDPPDWWPELPDPVLLVHGAGLNTAKFAIAGEGVTITRTQASANGHWCFLWLTTRRAKAQRLTITASNAQGEAKHSFALKERVHDPSAHAGFSAADAMYLIMTDRFADGDRNNDAASSERKLPRGWHGGDFAGIRDHIDYLKELGVTTVWLTPVVSNGSMPESYHGYAATDLYATDAHFGSVEEYRALSEALHKRGVKLVIDLVPNHLGVRHPWVEDPPAPEWFHGTLADHHRVEFDFLQLVDPHAPTAAWEYITHGWFTDAMPDLNQANPLVAQYLTQNAIWWIETAELDGIRLDTFPYVDRAFWQQYHAAIHAAYPHLTTVGEVFHPDAEVTSFFAGGVAHDGIDTELDTPFDFPVYFTLRKTLAHDEPMTELAKVLRQDSLYPHPERLVPFLGNHDTTRFLTDAGGSVARLKIALGVVATLRGMPQIYSGDEIAMPGGEDPDDRHDFPGGFPGDRRSAFVAEGRTAQEDEVFRWTAGLLHLRAQHPAITQGVEENLFADADGFAYARTLSHEGCAARPGDRLLIVMNKSKEAKTIELPMRETTLAGCNQFTALSQGAPAKVTSSAGKLRVEEPAESLSVFSVNE